MITRDPYRLPPDKQAKLRRAVRVEWVSLGFQASIVLVMYLAMGSSQAMMVALVEDALSVVPPIVFLVSMRYRDRAPTREFPYGYRRCTLLAFITASAAVMLMGVFLFLDSAHNLLTLHHPTLGHFDLFGTHVWIGWVMMAALFYSMLPPVILGRMKLKLAEALHEKTLHADATMNKADWMTAGAGILGVLGVGLGLWWTDAAAALFISFNVMHDGFGNLRGAMADLMDSRPHRISDGAPMHIEERVVERIKGVDGVLDAGARMREEGYTISGEIFVVLDGVGDLPDRLARIAERGAAVDWRLHDLVVAPVREVDGGGPDPRDE